MAVCLLAAVATGAASAGQGSGRHAAAQDLGKLSAVSSEQVTATVALKLRDASALEGLVASLYNPASPSYRKFLTADQFRARFAPDAGTVARVTASLRAQGLSTTLVDGMLLRVTGSSAAVERAFGVELHAYRAASGATFHAPTGAQRLGSLEADVVGVVGLDTRERYHPNLHRASAAVREHARLAPRGNQLPNTPDLPGEWTVVDFAGYYGVNPLYQRGVTGAGSTIGIVTLAAFTPSDAFAYWASLGLKVDPNRITVINIDGGAGAPSDDKGSDETTLDVEQSGGIAPGAKMIVYVAPNTDQGFIDAWAQAVNDNHADAISTSWGEWEAFLGAGQIQAFHNVFLQGAIQGQSLSAAAGDSGSYDDNGEVPPTFTNVLSVDHPAADSFIVAAGGTTLPGLQQFLLNDGSIFNVMVNKERAWSWDYLNGLCAALGFDPVSCGIFPVGGGGGVSSVFPVPFYQAGLGNIRTTEPGQVLEDTSTTPPTVFLTLPAHFAGRNLPDISFNADPDTGYTVFYTSSRSGFGVFDFFGGTSFVAPQLAGVSALIDQNAHGRVGFLNLAVYSLLFSNTAYNGNNPPLRDINSGNNEFYQAEHGYDQASGAGVMNVASFADLFR
jgi:subtilase family serine protease